MMAMAMCPEYVLQEKVKMLYSQLNITVIAVEKYVNYYLLYFLVDNDVKCYRCGGWGHKKSLFPTCRREFQVQPQNKGKTTITYQK